MSKITSSTNFQFIQERFIASKTGEKVNGVGLEGASRTGKTWDVSVFICHYLTSYTGKQVNICRDNLTKLKKTTYQTLKTVWVEQFKLSPHHFNKSATDIHYNGNIVRFVGINDDIMTAHGLESDLLWINEAMGISKETSNQLEQRTNEFFIYDYNPSAVDSWLFDKEKQRGYFLHKTTIFDNPYAPEKAKQKILSYAHPAVNDEHIAKKARYSALEWSDIKENNYLTGTADKYMWEVYGLGLRAVGEDIIFSGWKTYNEEPTECEWSHFGGDFGFKSDPSVLIRVTRNGHNLYLKEEMYEHGLLNNEIASFMHRNDLSRDLSVWDTSENKSIDELRGLNIPAQGADKGAGSVAYGIQIMQQFNIFVHEDSINLINEIKKYRWARQRNGDFKRNTFGKRVPVDKDNHAIDAARYGTTYYFDPVNNES